MIRSKTIFLLTLVIFLFPIYLTHESYAEIPFCLKDNLGGDWNLVKGMDGIFGTVAYPSGCQWDVAGGNEGINFGFHLEDGNCCETGYAEGSVTGLNPIRAEGVIAADCGDSFYDNVLWESCR